MAAIQGMRGTGQFGVDFRPKNYRELFTLLEPNGNAPLNALLAMGSSESTDDPEFKNFRDELPERVLTVSGAIASTSTGTITVAASDDNKYAIAGAILINATTGEVMQATADTTANSVTVTRNIGATSYQIADGAKLFVAGYAGAEGGKTPTPLSWDASVISNYTQIFRTAFSVTETMKHTYLRTGSKLEESATKALKIHMSDIERAMFFGIKNETNGSTNAPTRYTGGLLNTIDNVIDCASFSTANTMTEDTFDETLITSIFKYGSSQKIAFVGAKVANHLQQFGKNRWKPIQLSGTYGVSLTQYTTFAGDLMVHLHPQFRQIPGMDSSMVVIDFPYLRYRYLDGRDTQLLENRQNNDEDLVKHEYLTECGLELLQSKPHALIKNWKLRA
jgi:hypothetical protein